VAAVFTKVLIIDDTGSIIKNEDGQPAEKWFTCGSQNRFDWLNRFFFKGNCLCHPSMLIRKEALQKAGTWNSNFTQLADLDLYVRLCSVGELHVLEEKLTYFRILEGNKNLSAPRQDSRNRSIFEYSKLLEHYKGHFILENFRNIFTDYPGRDKTAEKLHYLINVSFRTKKFSHQIFAVNLFYDLLSNETTLKELQLIDPSIRRDYFSLAGDVDFSSWDLLEKMKNLSEFSKIQLENEKKRNLILEKDINYIRRSFTWKTGYIIIKPFAFLYDAFMRIFKMRAS
jgi:hypothetical protein